MMRNLVFSLLTALLWIALFALGVFAQTQKSVLPIGPDLNHSQRHQPFAIPPLEPSTGASITVTTTADELDGGGDCSLREAIQAANSDTAVGGCPAGDGEDLILLAAGTYRLALEGRSEDDNTTGDLDIRSSLMISGTGAEGTIIDADQIDRVLHVHEEAVVELRGITLRNGHAPDDLESGCGNEGSTTCAGEPGGGVANSGQLLLIDSLVMENRSGDSEFCAQGGDGGGVFNTGILFVIAATIADNRTGLGGYCGRGYAPAGHGSGIANRGTLTITNSQIHTNLTMGSGGNGGSVFNNGRAWIFASEIRSNSTGRSADGGGVFNAGTLILDGSAVYSNTAGADSGGGGLYNEGTALVVNSTISSAGFFRPFSCRRVLRQLHVTSCCGRSALLSPSTT